MTEADRNNNPEEIGKEINRLTGKLLSLGRIDVLLHAITFPVLEELHIEAARGRLSPLRITRDYHFILTSKGREIELQPVHKAVYLLFLAHPEGIKFKRLTDYRSELVAMYRNVAPAMEIEKIEESVSHLVNPLDNAINEKCSRIKKAFMSIMDEYSAGYYIISSHTKRHVAGSNRIWYERLKVVTLPRELIIREDLTEQ